MTNELREEAINKILKYNPDADLLKYESILNYCDILYSMDGIYIEVFNCICESDSMVTLRFGVYYAEIDLDYEHPFFDVINNSKSAEIYSVKYNSEDGYMFVVSMNFEIEE